MVPALQIILPNSFDYYTQGVTVTPIRNKNFPYFSQKLKSKNQIIKGYQFACLKYFLQNPSCIHSERVVLETNKIVLDVGNIFIKGENTV